MTDNTALIEVQPKAVINYDDSLKLQEMASGFFQSGLYPNVKNKFGAYAICQYGAELGVSPMISLQSINIISGKPCASGQLMLTLAMNHGVSYEVKKESDTECEIIFRRGETKYISRYTIDDAKKMALTGKDNWKKQPKTMLFWRAVANGVRKIAPDAVTGLYTPDELYDDPKVGPENAKTVDATVVDEPAPPPDKKPETSAQEQKELDSKFVENMGLLFNEANKILEQLKREPFKALQHFRNAVLKWANETSQEKRVTPKAVNISGTLPETDNKLNRLTLLDMFVTDRAKNTPEVVPPPSDDEPPDTNEY